MLKLSKTLLQVFKTSLKSETMKQSLSDGAFSNCPFGPL